MFLSYSQCVCSVAGCLMFFAFNSNKTMKTNERKEQQGMKKKEQEENTYIRRRRRRTNNNTVRAIKAIERQDNVRNHAQQQKTQE